MSTFTINIYGREAFLANNVTRMEQLRIRIMQEMKDQMVRLADYVRANKLSGQVLNRRTGTLSRSITGQVETLGTTVTGIVGTSGVPYARIHEFGAVFTRIVDIAWGRPMIPKEVTFHYPERSYLRSSANENIGVITDALKETAMEALRAT